MLDRKSFRRRMLNGGGGASAEKPVPAENPEAPALAQFEREVRSVLADRQERAQKQCTPRRNAYTDEQLQRLKDVYEENKIPSDEERAALAEELGVESKRITRWFQNRRNEERRASPTRSLSPARSGSARLPSSTRASSASARVGSPSVSAPTTTIATVESITTPSKKFVSERLEFPSAKSSAQGAGAPPVQSFDRAGAPPVQSFDRAGAPPVQSFDRAGAPSVQSFGRATPLSASVRKSLSDALANVPRFLGLDTDGRGELISPVNFAQKMKGKDAIVLVKKEWCGYCKKYEPEFAKLAEKMQEENGNIYKLYKVEIAGESEPELKIARDYEITGVPTILFFNRRGEWKKFQGERRPELIDSQFKEFVGK